MEINHVVDKLDKAREVCSSMLSAGLLPKDIDELCQMIYYSDAGKNDLDSDNHWDPLDVLTKIIGHSPDWRKIWYDDERHICFKLEEIDGERNWTYT